jgi:flagellar M-ring protein FliF
MAEGEVTRTILTMEDVRSAKVNIAYPEDEPLFEEDRVPLTASVAVTSLNPNVRLTPTTVDAIATITANSISGLDPQRVAIMDSRGRLYHPASDRDGIDPAQVLEQENQRRERERELERRLREEIGGVVGPQNVRVVASIDLDWGQESVTERALLPNPVTGEGFVISEESETEEYTGPSPQPGVPGVEPNVPPPPEGVPPTYPAVEMGPIEYSRTDDTVNTDYGERVTERKNLPPNTERKAVGIFLNEEEVSAEQLARIETVAQSQIDVARGDVIAVQLVPFAEEVMEEDVEEHWLRRYGRVIVAGLMLLIGLIVPFAVGRMAAPPPVEEEELEEGEEPEEGMAWEQLLAEQEAAEEDAARQQMIRQNQETFEFLRRTAEQNPEDFANALRAWLADD